MYPPLYPPFEIKKYLKPFRDPVNHDHIGAAICLNQAENLEQDAWGQLIEITDPLPHH